jgi:hypothetical protein
VNHPHKELASNLIKSMGWGFSILIVEEDTYGDNFGLGKTPIKALLKGKDQIYYVEGPLANWEKDGKLKEFIKDLL